MTKTYKITRSGRVMGELSICKANAHWIVIWDAFDIRSYSPEVARTEDDLAKWLIDWYCPGSTMEKAGVGRE